jgi:two-component system response regulator MprA
VLPDPADLAIVTPKVLLADDDRAIRDSLATALGLSGYQVTAAPDGVQALAAHQVATQAGEPFDLLVLDVMMPGVDGLGVVQVVRAQGSHVPIIMLTARTETADRVAGLDAGADDYLPKPFELDELLARMRALLRRAEVRVEPADSGTPDELAGSSSMVVGPVRLDESARRVWAHGDEVNLSRTEFDLLHLLMRNAGIVMEHHVIYDRIWGYDFGPDSKNLAVFIGYLRRKLNVPGDSLIRSVRGVGYTIRESGT